MNIGPLIGFFKNDGHFKGVIKNSSWLLSANTVGLGIDFLHTIVLARRLGVKDYGLLALISTYVIIVNQVIDFRVWETVVRYVSEFWVKEQKEKAVSAVKLCYLIDIAAGMVAFIIAVLSSKLAACYIIHAPDVYQLIVLYSVSLLFSTANGTSTAVLRVFDRFQRLSIYAVGTKMTRLVLVFCFLLAGYGLRGVIIAYIVAELFGGILLSALAFSVFRDHLWTARNAGILLIKDRFKEIGHFLLNTNLNETATLFTMNIDVVLLGYFRDPAEVGFYKLAKNIVSLMGTIIDPFYQALYPVLSKMWASRQAVEFKRMILKATLLMSGLNFPLLTLIYIFIPFVVEWTVGRNFMSVVPSVRIMLWGMLIAAVFFWCRPALLSMGKANVLTIANVFGSVTMLALSFILVPKSGYIGSSLMFVYPYLTGHIIAILYFFRFLKNESVGNAYQ